jgi:hypothetical protein
MVENLSAIGFSVKNRGQFEERVLETFRRGEPIVVDEGGYFRWRLECGAELWAVLTADKSYVGLIPHFDGSSRVSVELIERMPTRGDSPMNVAWRARVASKPDRPADKTAPDFIFASPDGSRHADLEIPARVTLQLTAFARELSVFRHERYYTADQLDPIPFVEQLIPTPVALFESSRQSGAVLTGRVVESARRTNEATGARFQWASVKTSIGLIDLVTSLDVVTGELRPGALVAGTVWLSGRLVRPELPGPKGFLRRLLGR